MRKGKIMETICRGIKLCEYCGARESCWDTVNRVKIVATSRGERTFSEQIIVIHVSICDVVMPNIIRVIMSRILRWRCIWHL